MIKAGGKIYFMGIGGTGMAAVAGLCQQAGYKIVGSDKGVYPPMSVMLKELGIPVATPYSEANLNKENPDLVVIANALSRGNVEMEYVLTNKVPYTSFPALLGDLFLKQKQSVVVAGTHGKTTTTSLLAHVLHDLKEYPSYMIGGIPKTLPKSFNFDSGKVFAIEGDEYDTAFFDKGPKFLHYQPKYVILNNIEFDHADIYQNAAAIEAQFEKLCELVKDPAKIIANVDDPGVERVLKRKGLSEKVLRVSTTGLHPDADFVVESTTATAVSERRQNWQANLRSKKHGLIQIETMLSGKHNIANTAQVTALLTSLNEAGDLSKKFSLQDFSRAISTFEGVRRRFDHLGSVKGIDVYEDFAHHPTAIRLVIDGFRKVFPQRRLIVAFEPANATGRRNILLKDFATSLADADYVLIGHCPVDERIPENERMSTQQMQTAIGQKAQAFADNEKLLDHATQSVQPGDAVIFMTSSSFSGVQYRILEKLRNRFSKLA